MDDLLPTPGLTNLRVEMEAITQLAYLNHAAMAPMPRRVHEAMARYLAGRRQFVDFDFDEEFDRVTKGLGESLAQLVNATPEEIGFVQNTSHGLNIAAQSLPLASGDNVIFCDMEFPANVYPWMLVSEQRGIETRCIPHDDGGLTVEALEAHADERTRAVAVSSVEFLTGFRTDLAAIGQWCTERDVIFVVDGIQSLGAVPMDVEAYQIDFLASGAVKWLMGPMGIGFIYCRQELLERTRPPMAGCLSVEGWEDWRDYDMTFPPDARRFYLGGPNFVGMTGMLAAVELLLQTGIEEIDRWTLHLTDQLIADLQSRGYEVASTLDPAHRSAIVSFSVPGDPEAALAKLKDAGVLVSMREEYIRVSPHGYNTEDEIAQVGEVLGNA